jgi:threonine aldolase
VGGVEEASAEAFCAALERAGVKMYAIGPQRVRAVTHLDVDRAGIEEAIAAARAALG